MNRGRACAAPVLFACLPVTQLYLSGNRAAHDLAKSTPGEPDNAGRGTRTRARSISFRTA